MFQAWRLMFEGGPFWDRIVLKEQGFVRVLLQRLLPMMVSTTVLEGWSLNHWGKWQPGYKFYRPFSLTEAVGYEAAQFTLNLLMILICARLVQTLGRTFHGRITYTYTRSFTSVVYGLSPMFLLRLLDPFPGMSPYVTWSIGILLSIWTLYDGLPRLLAPDPTHALGLFVSSSFVLFMATGLIRAVTAMYLQGNAGLAHSYLGRHLLNMLAP